MSLLSRWPRPVAALRKLFEADERALAVADTADAGAAADPATAADAVGSMAVATNLGLWLPDGRQWRRVGWHQVVKAAWTAEGLRLVEGELGPDGLVTDRDEIVIAFSEPRNLPIVVRARVENSIQRSERVTVPGGYGRVVARRVPGVDGITWTARLDAETPDTEAARQALRDQLARMSAAADPDSG